MKLLQQLVLGLLPVLMDTGVQVWNSLEINEMIRDPESGYSYEEGLLFGGKPRVNASDDKVRASSEKGGNLARYAADGNLSTFWAPDLPNIILSRRRDINPNFHWLEIDLGRIETVHAVTLRSGLDCLDSDFDVYDEYYNNEYDFHSPFGISVSNARINSENKSLLAKENNITSLLQDSVYHLPKPQTGQYLLVQYSHIENTFFSIYRIRIAELIVHTTEVAVCAEGERQCPDFTCINYDPCSSRTCSYQEGIECCDYREAYPQRIWDGMSSTLEFIPKFEWTPEAITSLAILQLPAIALALLGLTRATTRSDVFKALVLAFVPFLLLDLLDALLAFCLQKCAKKGLEKTGLLRFLGPTEEQRALAQDTARAFSGHAIQLLFQTVLILGFTPWRSHRDSQLISIASSLFLLIKVSAQLITFKKEAEEESEEDERNTKEKVKDFVVEKLKLLQAFFSLFPFLVSSVVFNVGTMALAISVLGWHSLWFIIGSLLLHLLLFFSLPLPDNLDLKMVKVFNLEKLLPENNSEQRSKPFLSSLFFSSTNLFIFSCSTGAAKVHRITFLLYLQLLRFLLNTSLLLLVLLFGFNANFRSVGLMAGVLEVFGLILLSLVCNSSATWIKLLATKEQP